MKDLFDLKNRQVTFSPAALMIPEFKALWDRDESKDKYTALREISYVYFFTDFKSPYVAALSPEILERTIAKDYLKDESYTPDAEVIAAIDKYRELQITPSMLLLKAAIKTVHNLTDYLENVDLQERDKNDKPIYKPNDITGALSKIGNIVESLQKVKENVEREIMHSAQLRGQRQKGNREDP